MASVALNGLRFRRIATKSTYSRSIHQRRNDVAGSSIMQLPSVPGDADVKPDISQVALEDLPAIGLIIPGASEDAVSSHFTEDSRHNSGDLVLPANGIHENGINENDTAAVLDVGQLARAEPYTDVDVKYEEVDDDDADYLGKDVVDMGGAAQRLATCRYEGCTYRCTRTRMRSHYRREHMTELERGREQLDRRRYRRERQAREKEQAARQGREFSSPCAPCPYCGVEYKKSGLRGHMRKHTNPADYPCPQCHRAFSMPSELKAHLTSHRPPQLECEVCQKKYMNKSGLRQHIRSKHLQVTNHSCYVCGKGFFLRNDLTEHMSSHSDRRPFQCEECDKTFALKKYLSRHVQYTHQQGPLTSHCCQYCGQGHQNKERQQRHELYCEKGPAPLPRKPPAVARFTCTYCNKTFANRASCRYHERHQHLKEPVLTHVCDLCGKGHQRPSELLRHSKFCRRKHMKLEIEEN